MKSERSPFKTIFIAVVSSTLVLAALSYLLYFHPFSLLWNSDRAGIQRSG